MLTQHILLKLLCFCLIVRCSFQRLPPGGDINRPTPRPGTTPGISSSTRCRGNSDTIFLLDSSGSIGASNFQIMLRMVALMSYASRPIGPSANQVGVEVFSTNAATEIRLKDYSSFSPLAAAISRINYIGGLTYTNKGLRRMCDVGFSRGYGDRSSAPNVGIVLTDGHSTNNAATIREARRCRRKGITLLAIPIGNNVDMEEIRAITGSRSYIIPASNFDELVKPGFIANVLGVRCSALG